MGRHHVWCVSARPVWTALCVSRKSNNVEHYSQGSVRLPSWVPALNHCQTLTTCLSSSRERLGNLHQRRAPSRHASIYALMQHFHCNSGFRSQVLRETTLLGDGFHEKYPGPNKVVRRYPHSLSGCNRVCRNALFWQAVYEAKVANGTLCNRGPVLRVPWAVTLRLGY